MKHKTMKISMGVSLLVCAMLSLAGVAFAIAYQGSATNQNNEADSDLITVNLDNWSGFISGSYSVDTLNNGTTIALSNLMKGGTAVDPMYTAKKFKYSGSAFSLVDAYDIGDATYSSAEIGSITVTITEEKVTAESKVNLAITGAQTSVINQYGLSFLYVYNDAIFNPSDGIANLNISSGTVSVTLKAYVVFSDSVPYANIGDINAFDLARADITFTATPVTA